MRQFIAEPSDTGHAAEIGTRRTYLSIQWLRGVAAALVVIHHSVMVLPDAAIGSSAAAGWAMLAAPCLAGVDIFFVISGFVMAGMTDGEQPPSAARFLMRRALRIYPLYWLTTLICLPSVLLGLGSGRGQSLSAALWSLTLWPQARLVVEQGWTLTHELLFYLVVAAALALNLRHRLTAIVAALVAVAVLQAATETTALHGYVISSFMAEFLAGLLIYHARYRLARCLPGGTGVVCWALAALLLAVVALALTSDPTSLTTAARVLCFGTPAALLVAGAVALELGGSTTRPGWIGTTAQTLGDTSYSIYLVHPVALGGIGWLLSHGPPLGGPAILIALVSAITVAIAYGVVIGRVIELPLQRFLSNWLARSLTPADRPLSAPAE